MYQIYYMNDNLLIKTYPNRYNRTITLARNSSPIYTAALDSNNNIHIVYKNRENKIIHLSESNTNFKRNIILDDVSNNYQITNMNLIIFNQNMYLFYTAKNPYDQSYDLIFHQFDNNNESPQSLVSLIDLSSSYDVILLNNQIKVICFTHSENYQINLFTYDISSKEWLEENILLKQTMPIHYLSTCIDANTNMHITFVSEQFGRYQLHYKNEHSSNSQLLYTSPFNLEPIIFEYEKFLWINFLENNTNKMMFSTNNGMQFSEVSKASLQNEYLEKVFLITPNDLIYGKKYFGLMNPNPIISIFSQIDLHNILLTQNTNPELTMLIKSLQSKKELSVQDNTLKEEINYLKQVQESITNQYNDLSKFAKDLQKEGKNWKNKYLKSEIQINKLKESIQALKKDKILQTTSILNTQEESNTSPNNLQTEDIQPKELNNEEENDTNIL